MVFILQQTNKQKNWRQTELLLYIPRMLIYFVLIPVSNLAAVEGLA